MTIIFQLLNSYFRNQYFENMVRIELDLNVNNIDWQSVKEAVGSSCPYHF